ncbi:UNVERIFIED_CONTAM: hypothetical protein RMT77_014923 [Armadillidium vulgare]
MNFKFALIIIPHVLVIHNVSAQRWKSSSMYPPKEAWVGAWMRGPTFQSVPHMSGYKDDLNHECNRNCQGDSRIKKCYYKFQVEHYTTMSKACYNCPFNITDCLRPHCVVADGIERALVSVNRRVPGPIIHVCEKDEIIVDVVNDLISDSTSIHWHGIHQVGTQYMDGVPFLTQCPVHSGNWFRYHFIADPTGTHFWHSHSGFQRADGMFGSLIVRSRNDPQRHLYDVDDPEHVMLVMDWLDVLGIEKHVSHHHDMFDADPYNILINGMGKFKVLQEGNKMANAPLYEYRVKSGLRYRFRAISNGVEGCPIEISVQNHTLLVIASDGSNIKPLEVNSLVIYGGERWDFIINANQKPGTYFFKYRGRLLCDSDFLSVHQVAVLRYEGQTGFPNTPEEVNYDFTKPAEGLQLNKLNDAPGDLKTFYTVADMKKLDKNEAYSPYARKPDHKFFLETDFYGIDNDWFHHKEYYPFLGVDEAHRTLLPLLNHISLKLPNVPPLSQPKSVNQNLYCNSSTVTNCEEQFCRCTHKLDVKLGSLVEIILVDTGSLDANHPFHLHGYLFAVLGMEKVGDIITLEDIQNLDKKGNLRRNLKDFPFKDTVTVPDGGYTVIRFIADNPGFWLFHCHLIFHLENGLGAVFHVGEQEDLPPVPSGFPKCGSWLPRPAYDLNANIRKSTKKSVAPY